MEYSPEQTIFWDITPTQTHLKQEIIPNMFSDYSGVKLEINNKNKWEIPKYLEIRQQTSEKQRVKQTSQDKLSHF